MSSQSSGGAFSVNEATPSPSPLTPTPTPSLLPTYEHELGLESPSNPAESTTDVLDSPFKYLDINVLSSQPSPIKLVPMSDEGVAELSFLDYYVSPGVSPLKGVSLVKQFKGGRIVPNEQKETLLTIAEIPLSTRPTTPPILRRSSKSRRRRDSGNTSSEYSTIEVQIPSENVRITLIYLKCY